MNMLELSQSRYSVRAYQSQPVSAEDLQYVFECARLAPSACNRQPWHFYVCQSEDALQKVRQCYPRDWFNTAPAVIICTIDHEEEWVRPADDHRHGIVDISIAAEHICLSAAERGMGTCWVCNFDVQKCHELFNLLVNEEAAILIPLGYPASEIAEKKRKAMDEIVTML